MLANYSVELLMGHGYERLGDSILARKHYLRAVALLQSEVGEMPALPNIAPAVESADRFLRGAGDQGPARALRRDPRVAVFFDSP
jgi:hypothetical protein